VVDDAAFSAGLDAVAGVGVSVCGFACPAGLGSVLSSSIVYGVTVAVVAGSLDGFSAGFGASDHGFVAVASGTISVIVGVIVVNAG
jgi:hypothetical protein